MIAECRQMIADALEGAAWPIYPYKPDSLDEVPCIVVDRPTIDIDVQLNTITCPVVVIGQRDNSEESQSMLDNITSQTAYMLAGPDLAVLHVEPAMASVAELLYPAYRITVACGQIKCREA